MAGGKLDELLSGKKLRQQQGNEESVPLVVIEVSGVMEAEFFPCVDRKKLLEIVWDP